MPIDKFNNSYNEGGGNVDIVDIIRKVLNIINFDLNKKASKITDAVGNTLLLCTTDGDIIESSVKYSTANESNDKNTNALTLYKMK